MSSTSPIALILGAGSRVGQHVARGFASKGYKVALVARKPKETDDTADQVNISCDLSNPEAVVDVFSKVKASLGIPSVVVYNAAAVTFNDPKNPFAISVADFTRDHNVNTMSVYVAAQQSVLGFSQLPSTAARTFIFTGNILNVSPILNLFDNGVGKSATAHIIQCAATAYQPQGFKFYYADERKPDGGAAFQIDGEAHAKLYMDLAEDAQQRPWQQTFVKDVGYKSFPVA